MGRQEEVSPRILSHPCRAWLKAGIPEPGRGASHTRRGQEPEAVASEALHEVLPPGPAPQGERQTGTAPEPGLRQVTLGGLPGLPGQMLAWPRAWTHEEGRAPKHLV